MLVLKTDAAHPESCKALKYIGSLTNEALTPKSI